MINHKNTAPTFNYSFSKFDFPVRDFSGLEICIFFAIPVLRLIVVSVIIQIHRETNQVFQLL